MSNKRDDEVIFNRKVFGWSASLFCLMVVGGYFDPVGTAYTVSGVVFGLLFIVFFTASQNM